MSNEDPKKDQQTVVENKGAAKPAPASDNAQGDDLDNLLNEFETATRPDPKVEQPTTESNDDVVKWVREERERRKAEDQERLVAKTKEDINKAVGFIKEGLELPVKVSDRVLRGILHAIAEEDPRFSNAFVNRESNPAAWNRILKGVKQKVVEEFSVDPEATATNDAIAGAVHSASNSAPERKEEFNEKEVRRMGMDELSKKYPELNRNF